ncbi:MAG: ice-binding family protein [Gaiellaceae bacterium]
MKSFKYSLGGVRSRTYTALLLLASLIALTFVASGSGRSTAQAPVPLGNAATFGALSFTAMTNAGLDTVVNGDIGSSTSIGAGVTHPGHAAYGAGSVELAAAQASLSTAYLNASAQTPTGDITGANLAGRTLTAGVYNSTGAILISGPIALTLDGGGDPNAVFIFQAAAAGDLTVDPTSSVTYTNGAQPCNVFWKVQSAFLKNSGNTFVGTILAGTQITLTDNITVQGRVLAQTADVTFIHDTVNVPTCAAPPTPTPPTPPTPPVPVPTPPVPTPTPPTPPVPVPTPPVTTPTPTPPTTTTPAPPPKPKPKPAKKGVAAATRTFAKPVKTHAAFTG